MAERNKSKMTELRIDLSHIRENRGSFRAHTPARLDIYDGDLVTRCFISIHPHTALDAQTDINISLVGRYGEYESKTLRINLDDALHKSEITK